MNGSVLLGRDDSLAHVLKFAPSWYHTKKSVKGFLKNIFIIESVKPILKKVQ